VRFVASAAAVEKNQIHKTGTYMHVYQVILSLYKFCYSYSCIDNVKCTVVNEFVCTIVG